MTLKYFIFHGRNDLAISTNKLFELGFYHLNIGFALFIMVINYSINRKQQLLEVLSQKLEGYSIYLGVMLFFNLYVLFGEEGFQNNVNWFSYYTSSPGSARITAHESHLISPFSGRNEVWFFYYILYYLLSPTSIF
jgi:hypothetical protein